ncbi:hypothetical protein LZC95_09365 [Pendulispora brunnea]|uniref:ParB/Sulfiredoxin domain-containing protein n=1 Tax=Pendulispora brunnea TaxID=2905690 RepID=A0ABZ2KHL4_9BACT
MPILLVELPVDVPVLDEPKCPDPDDKFIFDHLVRYCATFDPLPAITVRVDGDVAIVSRGHKYLRAARALGRSTVRAVIASAPTNSNVRAFLVREDVRTLDWDTLRRKEEEEANPKGWHVLFFERPLSDLEREDLEERVGALFGVGEVQILYDDAGPCAEFEAITPILDPEWAAKYLAALLSFSRDRVRILSYQGQRLLPD